MKTLGPSLENTLAEAEKPGYQDRRRKIGVSSSNIDFNVFASKTQGIEVADDQKPIIFLKIEEKEGNLTTSCPFLQEEDEKIDFDTLNAEQKHLLDSLNLPKEKKKTDSSLEKVVVPLIQAALSTSAAQDIVKFSKNKLEFEFDVVHESPFAAISPPELDCRTCFGYYGNIPDFMVRFRIDEDQKPWKNNNDLDNFVPLFFIEVKGTIGDSTQLEQKWERQAVGYGFYILLMMMKVYGRSSVEEIMKNCGDDFFWGFSIDAETIGFTGIRIGEKTGKLEYAKQFINLQKDEKKVEEKKETDESKSETENEQKLAIIRECLNNYFNYTIKFTTELEKLVGSKKDTILSKKNNKSEYLHSIFFHKYGDAKSLIETQNFVEEFSIANNTWVGKHFRFSEKNYFKNWDLAIRAITGISESKKGNSQFCKDVDYYFHRGPHLVAMPKCQSHKFWTGMIQKDSQKFQKLVRDILELLDDLELCLLSHNDVRIPNICYDENKNIFILIDWDFSSGTEPSEIRKSTFPALLRDVNSIFAPNSDFGLVDSWQFIHTLLKLLENSNYSEKRKDLEELIEKLKQDDYSTDIKGRRLHNDLRKVFDLPEKQYAPAKNPSIFFDDIESIIFDENGKPTEIESIFFDEKGKPIEKARKIEKKE